MGDLISVYVDASEMCNNLAFQLGTSNDVMKQWTIKVDFTNNIFSIYQNDALKIFLIHR